jgi:RNA polymerase sigma-70 factor (ECF subfamily)
VASIQEKELVKQILKGDESAFQELYITHRKALIRACYYFLGQDTEVEDVVQEAFIKALKYLPNFRHECSLGTWLNHIAANLCRDLLEKRKKSFPVSVDYFSQTPSRTQGRGYPPEALAAIREQIQALDGRDRELLTLREIEGASYEVIAHKLRIPLGSVTSGLYRARQRLIENIRRRFPNGWEETTP